MASENGMFKVGDRVKALVNWCNLKAGQEYVVDFIDDEGDAHVSDGNGKTFFMCDNEIELVPAWQPKVGDRVRIVDPSMFMRGTKIGDLATIERIGSSYIDILLEHPTEGIISQIAKLEDIEPTPATSKPASNDNAAAAKPKFKVGDLVLVVGNQPGLISKIGKNGTVESVIGPTSYTVKLGDSGAFVFAESELSSATTTHAIVALIENGTPRPSTAPKVHTSQEAATTEAERLALEHPGQQFGIFVLADSKIADLVMTQTAVLRAA